jgi:putative exporter of polyketide antibiotics
MSYVLTISTRRIAIVFAVLLAVAALAAVTLSAIVGTSGQSNARRTVCQRVRANAALLSVWG